MTSHFSYPAATGHADHFLSRLDRLATAEAELALQLYRDPGLIDGSRHGGACLLAALAASDHGG